MLLWQPLELLSLHASCATPAATSTPEIKMPAFSPDWVGPLNGPFSILGFPACTSPQKQSWLAGCRPARGSLRGQSPFIVEQDVPLFACLGIQLTLEKFKLNLNLIPAPTPSYLIVVPQGFLAISAYIIVLEFISNKKELNINLVETVGVEPTSESNPSSASTCVVGVLDWVGGVHRQTSHTLRRLWFRSSGVCETSELSH